MHAVFAKHGEKGIPAALRTADPHRICCSAERRGVVRDICRTARNHALLSLLQDEHGGLTRDARNCTVEVDIRHHVPDDKDGDIRHLFKCIYHGVNSHLTFHESCFERYRRMICEQCRSWNQ